MHQLQIPWKIQFGQGSQDAAENQKGEWNDQYHRKQFVAQNVTDFLDAPKIS